MGIGIGEPCVHHIDEFSGHCVWGNEVKLYNNNVRNLRKIINNKKTPDYYYVCHMMETFATPGKRMVISHKSFAVFHSIICWKLIC